MNNLNNILILILVIACLLDFLDLNSLHNVLKIILLLIILVLFIKKHKNELFSIFKSYKTNEIKDNGNIFYENPTKKTKKLPTGLEKPDLSYLDKKDLFMFKKNKCSPDCCPSQYSCDRGCVCLSEDQEAVLYLNGGNKSKPTIL